MEVAKEQFEKNDFILSQPRLARFWIFVKNIGYGAGRGRGV